MKILDTDSYDSNKKIIEYPEYIKAIGGDGTLLKAIFGYRYKNKPFYGEARGTVNFLMNKESTPLESCKIKKFNLINVTIYTDDDIFEYSAFNDVMIGGDMNSWIDFDIKEKDCIFGNFKGSGLIISTPQGSTGVNKNNNGSILPLSSNLWSITGDKTNRNVNYVIKPTDIEINVQSRSSVSVWVDGSNIVVNNVHKVEISKGQKVQVIFNEYSEFKKKRRL